MMVNLDENGVFLKTKLMKSCINIAILCKFAAVAETEFFEKDSERVSGVAGTKPGLRPQRAHHRRRQHIVTTNGS